MIFIYESNIRHNMRGRNLWVYNSGYLDLLCLGTFLWDRMKSEIHECPKETNVDLVPRIAVVTSGIQEISLLTYISP